MKSFLFTGCYKTRQWLLIMFTTAKIIITTIYCQIHDDSRIEGFSLRERQPTHMLSLVLTLFHAVCLVKDLVLAMWGFFEINFGKRSNCLKLSWDRSYFKQF